MDFFDVESHVRLSLPAAKHQVIYFFRTGPGALQHPALGYALYHLQRKKDIAFNVSGSLRRSGTEQTNRNVLGNSG